MVLVVKADVVGQPVKGSVVSKSLGHGDPVGRIALRGRDRLVDVVLGDEVAGEGVQAAGEEGGEEEIEQGRPGQVADDAEVKGELDDQVGKGDPGEGDLVDRHGADGVKEDLEGAEEGLSEEGIEKQSLEGGGEVCVYTVDAERLVVGEVVGLGKKCQLLSPALLFAGSDDGFPQARTWICILP